MSSTTTRGLTRILEIPELVSLLCVSLDRSDCVRFSRICHAAFNWTLPLIWRDVDGAYSLLKLLNKSQITYEESNQNVKTVVG
jgi:hypothetical protein